MIVFDELRVTNDGKQLKIAAHINENPIYSDLKITGIYVYNDELEGHLYGDLRSTLDNVEPLWSKEYTRDDNMREVSVTIDLGEAISSRQVKINSPYNTFSNNLWFVYIQTDGVIDGGNCIPCTSELAELGVTFDTRLLYNMGLGYINELGQECNIPKGFIDFILQFEAMKIAIETCNYPLAVKLFQRLFKFIRLGKEKPVKFKPCGCNGKNSV